MIASAERPLPTASPRPVLSWRVTLANDETCIVEADCFRVEGGAVIFMKPVKQRYRSVDSRLEYGDCLRACFASILELPLDDVVH